MRARTLNWLVYQESVGAHRKSHSKAILKLISTSLYVTCYLISDLRHICSLQHSQNMRAYKRISYFAVSGMLCLRHCRNVITFLKKSRRPLCSTTRWRKPCFHCHMTEMLPSVQRLPYFCGVRACKATALLQKNNVKSTP